MKDTEFQRRCAQRRQLAAGNTHAIAELKQEFAGNVHCHPAQHVHDGPKHSFLVHLIDSKTSHWGRCIVQTPCPSGMQERMTELATTGSLVVADRNGERFTMDHPRVVFIDPKAAAHRPILDPVTEP